MSFSFIFVVFPLAISTATSLRIGSLLLEQRIFTCVIITILSIIFGTLFSSGAAYGLIVYRDVFGYLTTNDESVIFRV